MARMILPNFVCALTTDLPWIPHLRAFLKCLETSINATGILSQGIFTARSIEIASEACGLDIAQTSHPSIEIFPCRVFCSAVQSLRLISPTAQTSFRARPEKFFC